MFVQQMLLAGVVAITASTVVHAEYDRTNPFYPSPQRNLAALETPDSATAGFPSGQEKSPDTANRSQRGDDGLSRAQREGLERKARNTELERQGFTSRVP